MQTARSLDVSGFPRGRDRSAQRPSASRSSVRCASLYGQWPTRSLHPESGPGRGWRTAHGLTYQATPVPCSSNGARSAPSPAVPPRLYAVELKILDLCAKRQYEQRGVRVRVTEMGSTRFQCNKWRERSIPALAHNFVRLHITIATEPEWGAHAVWTDSPPPINGCDKTCICH